MAVAETSGFLAGRSETPGFSVLVGWFSDPLHGWVTSDDFVVGVDHEDFVVFVGRVLSNPVRVEYSRIAHSFTGTFFGDRLDSVLEFQRVDTLVDGFTVGGTLGSKSLPAAPSYSDTVDDMT